MRSFAKLKNISETMGENQTSYQNIPFSKKFITNFIVSDFWVIDVCPALINAISFSMPA
jgi:hypothetical protein